MVSLIITYIRHAVPACCKGNATGPESISCYNWRLIGDVYPSSGYWSCEEYDLWPVQDIEMVINRSRDRLWSLGCDRKNLWIEELWKHPLNSIKWAFRGFWRMGFVTVKAGVERTS